MSFSQRGEAERETIKEHFLRTLPGSFSRYTEVILKERHRALQRGECEKRRVGQRRKVRCGGKGVWGVNGCVIEVERQIQVNKSSFMSCRWCTSENFPAGADGCVSTD